MPPVRRIRRLWSKNELVITLALYFQLPFGRLNHSTPEVKRLAQIIGRTNNSVALRLVNFAACDPYIINSGRHGMSAGMDVCKPVWDEYINDKETLFLEAERIKAEFLNKPIEEVLNIKATDLEGVDKETVIKRRVNQDVFRNMILNNYDECCAITGINIPELLVASHIIPWSKNKQERLNPSNGICLSALYDKAFDQGLITIKPDDYTVVLSSALLEYHTESFFDRHFKSIEKRRIIMPEEYAPKPDFLAYHRDNIFKGV